MVSLGPGNGGKNGNRSGAYFFEDDSDDQSGGDSAPLIRHTATSSDSSTSHTHIFTGYLSIMEAIVLILYAGVLVGVQVMVEVDNGTDSSLSIDQKITNHLHDVIAAFCMAHVGLWLFVILFDRIIQWRHQVLRRKGYLKFYRKMRNVRRIPFVVVSFANAVLLLFISFLILCQASIKNCNIFDKSTGFQPVVVLDIIVALELFFTIPCLLYYIVQAILFNCAANPPDVIRETYSGPGSPSNSVTTVGFRDSEDMDELLERQADMIRYLQQHNANLGRRILELQAQAME